jgi:lipooligosaccharide transport system permease protein
VSAVTGLRAAPALRLTERNLLVTRQSIWVAIAGALEPVFFLLSIGIGVGAFVGDLTVGDQVVSYRSFVAPALLAVTAMNGAVFESTFNFFVKLRYMKTYDAVLATPLSPRDVAMGELVFTVLRGTIYGVAFLVTMTLLGLVPSWWALGAIPVAAAVTFGFAGAGLGATTYMRSFVDFDKVWIVVMPLFLFSGTFFPLDDYPGWIATLVRVLPLHQGIEACRLLVLGQPSWAVLGHVAYLLAMGAIGLQIAGRRIAVLLTP